MSFRFKLFSALAIFCIPSAFAENRAIVFSTTCPEYESTMDDVGGFVTAAAGELDPLKDAGWNVVPLLAGNSVWCQEGTQGCKRSRAGNMDQLLKKSSFKSFQVKPASKVNLLEALNAALDGPNALHAGDKLLVSVITHGNREIFCSADGYVAYQTIVPIFKKLKDKGIQMGFDADHCFSGGGVQKLSPYACVVSIASAATTGLEGNPTIENLLADHPNPSLEDLYLSRTVSYNSLMRLREPEISGFTPGAVINDTVSDKFYPGDKNDLNNNTLVARCASEDHYYGRNCDLLADSLKNFQALFEPWENSSQIHDHSREILALMDRYPETHFMDVRHFGPMESITDPQFYSNLSSNFEHIRQDAAELHTLLAAEERGLSLVKQARFPHYVFSTANLAEPGTDELLLRIVQKTLAYYHLPMADASGRISDPRALVSFLTRENIRELSHSMGNEYYVALLNFHHEPVPDVNSDDEDDTVAAPKSPGVKKTAEAWQNLIYDRLNESITPYFDRVKTDSRAELQSFLLSHGAEVAKQAAAKINLEKEYNAFNYQFSGRFSYSLTSAYFDYKAKLSSSDHLSPSEASDKVMLDSCSNFKLR